MQPHAEQGNPEVSMRTVTASLLTLALVVLGCPAAGNPTAPGQPRPVGPDPVTSAAASSAPTLTPPEQIPPERRVHAYIDGAHRVMDIDDARSLGLTVVDLSDDWVPYIFWSTTPGKEDHKANDYLDTYVDLANDRIDVDGVALRSWERNYLEVYGIPPSLSVLRRRFVEDEQKACFKQLDLSVFHEGYHGPIKIVDPQGCEAEQRRYYAARAAYRAALRKARVRTLEALLRKPAFRKVAEKYQRYSWRHRAIRAMQKRLACEGMYGRRTPKVKPGVINWAVRQALRTFERKHNIYGWGMIFQTTADALGRTPRENNFESLKRAITERMVSAARIVEDGTIRKATYRSRSGKRLPVRNLVEEFSSAILRHMGLTDADAGLAFIQRHGEQDLQRLFVAVPLPKVPEYYADHMDLSVEIDRGDVWYDVPFDLKTGKRKPQPRARLPHLKLFVTYEKQKIPLVRWRTTIGGWQPEMRHDEEYYKYKISDVGPRIWRHIVAGPVWIPPKLTPSRDMVKIRPVRGRGQRIVAHHSFGPGYASAYGLVAAFHVTKDGRDNQVRTHGSVNYMSIRGGFSHGCHRLYNYRAVRLFSFLLAHRTFERIGQKRLAYDARFEHLGEEFQMDVRTRGYFYELKPPLPVEVLEGRIKGETKDPIEEYVKKPSVVYQEDLAGVKRTGKPSAGAPRVTPKKPSSMSQPQNL
jgi:hypothetical protein